MYFSKLLLDYWLVQKDYLQISVFLDLIVVEQEEVSNVLQKKLLEKSKLKWWKDSWLNAVKFNLWDVNLSFYQAFFI